MLDQNALQTFVLVADQLNFTTVAEQRHTVQSAISAQIKKLEQSTGQTLVARGRGQPMDLTPEGKAFLVYARRILALSDEAVETMRRARRQPTIRLGTTVTLAMSVVPKALRLFSSKSADTEIEILCDRSDTLLEHLDRGDIDVAFMMDQGRRADRAFVHSQSLIWVCSEDCTLAAHDDVPLSFLSDGRDLRRFAFAALDDANRAGHIACSSPHPIGVRAFVQAGLAVTIMPKATVEPPLREAPEAFALPPLAKIGLAAYLSKSQSQDAAKFLIDVLEATIT